MKKEFIVERQGKSFVLYAGLLDLAHSEGLKSIKTELIQIPGEGNNRTAIAFCTATFEKDGKETTWTGIGDAATNNVAPAMQTCLIRMAETRSKARALRDAVNVGVAALEELGEDGAGQGEGGYKNHRQTVRPPQRQEPPRNFPQEPQQEPVSRGGQCPDCHAPEGKPHSKSCPSVAVAA